VEDPDVRRGSDVLDAIWEKVADQPQRSDSASLIFRAKALEQLDVAAEVDNQLPLVSRRSWLLLVGVAVLVAAFALWASLTPSVTSITAPVRIVAAPGASPVVAPAAGVLLSQAVVAGDLVAPGQQVATLGTEGGEVPVLSAVDGTVWQLPLVPGSAVPAGGELMTLLPSGSTEAALLPIPEAQAAAIAPGMSVNVVAGPMVAGTVTGVSAPLSAVDAGQRTGLVLPPGTTYVLVTVALDAPLAAGASGSAQVILSDGTVITRLLGF
jgi:biotin carboxyl carrier protein